MHNLRISVEANGNELYAQNYKVIVKKAKTISVKVNGEEIKFSQSPVIIGGRTLVPLLAIFTAFGADVDWDDGTRTVIINYNNQTKFLD